MQAAMLLVSCCVRSPYDVGPQQQHGAQHQQDDAHVGDVVAYLRW